MSSNSQTAKGYLMAHPDFPSYPLHEKFRLMQADTKAASLTGRSPSSAFDVVSKVSEAHSASLQELMVKMRQVVGESAEDREASMKTLGLLSNVQESGSSVSKEKTKKKQKETESSENQTKPNQFSGLLKSIGARATKVTKKSKSPAATSVKAQTPVAAEETKTENVVGETVESSDSDDSDDGDSESSEDEDESDNDDEGGSDDEGEDSDDDGEGADGGDDYHSVIDGLAVALQHKGFSPAKIREMVKGHGGMSLIKKLTSIIFCGNNFSDRLKKVEDKKVGMSLIREFRKHKVKTSRGEGGQEVLVLSRIAIAHAPVLLIIRKRLGKKGQLPASQFGTSCPLEWQDLSLAGMPNKPEGYKEFYLKFGLALHKADADSDKKLTEEQVNEISAGWIEKSENGFSADTALHKIPTTRKSLNIAMSMLGY